MDNYSIRKMAFSDIDAVLKIDEASFPNPWSRKIYEQEITDNVYAHYFVLEIEEELVGYVGMWIVNEDAQITNIAVDPNYRGQKFGEILFDFALNYARTFGVVRLSLEVRKSNYVAQNLYRKFGLVPGGVRKNYYTDNGEDALVMWVKLCRIIMKSF